MMRRHEKEYISHAYIKYILIKRSYINSKIIFLKEVVFFETEVVFFFSVFNFLIHISYDFRYEKNKV